MYQIEVSADVCQGLTALGVPYRMLNGTPETMVKRAWSNQGVELAPGTDLQAAYKGRTWNARIDDRGRYVVEGFLNQPRFSPSGAAALFSEGKAVNGWSLWLVRLHGETEWVPLNQLRGGRAKIGKKK
jgi:hypothetical protein